MEGSFRFVILDRSDKSSRCLGCLLSSIGESFFLVVLDVSQ